MKNFELHIDFRLEDSLKLDLQINSGHYHYFYCNDPSVCKIFFDWLEGKKYFSENTLAFSVENNVITDFLLLRKHLNIIRFRLKEDESGLFYYQQRYHATENDDIIKVHDFLGETREKLEDELLEKFNLRATLNETVNMLSTGEFRKIFLLKHVFTTADIVFIEEPYAGIDAESREPLNQVFNYLCSIGKSVIIVSSEEHSSYSAHFKTEIKRDSNNISLKETQIEIPPLSDIPCSVETIRLKDITASFNERIILNKINWKIAQGEKWRLSGKNGAGKSTLLSFIYADNPQVYSNEVYLFGQKRGSGESIWDIKDNIGFYSTEFHRYFNKSLSLEEALRRIIFQNPYKKRVFSEKENECKESLLAFYNLQHKKEKMLYDLTQVEQKIILLVGVLLKNAPVLILDEPFQGFDEENIAKSKWILEKYIVNRTFIMVTHKPEELPAQVDKHFMLENGTGMQFENLKI